MFDALDAAKASVEKMWNDLQSLEASLAGDITAEIAHTATQHYRQLPTFGVNWGLIGSF
jgi:hypothetical protein